MSYYVTQINKNGNIAVDDTILVNGQPAMAGSHILEGFKPLFSAEAVTRLENSGYTVAGKTHTGEFGLDLVGEYSYYAPQSGTLAGAAASLVSENAVVAALQVDMNGSPRRAAAISKVDFLKPTYGTVSRYGVISCAASGEQLGVCAGNVADVARVMSIIAGHDPKDGTSLKTESYTYNTNEAVSGKKVCIVKQLFDSADDAVKNSIIDLKQKLVNNGVTVEEISLDWFNIANTAWQILMCAETCNNVSRYDGVKFGYRAKQYKNIDELYVNTRTEGFNFLTKSVILYGSDVLSKSRYTDCYDRSLRIRRVIAQKLTSLFESYDAILTPAVSSFNLEACDISSAFMRVFGESIYTSTANLTGIPALVTGGVQLMGKQFGESTLLSLAAVTEKEV